MNPSLETDFAYTSPYNTEKNCLHNCEWVSRYISVVQVMLTLDIVSLHWLISLSIILWSLFPVLLGYKTAFNQKPRIVTALILILLITYETPFLNISKVNIKARSIFGNKYIFYIL